LSALEKKRSTLRDLEQKQAATIYCLHGTKFGKVSITDDAIRRVNASKNDKHFLEKKEALAAEKANNTQHEALEPI